MVSYHHSPLRGYRLLYPLALVGGSLYATQKRRVVVVLVNLAATSGKAALRAAVSILVEVTCFHVILYSPSCTASESPINAFIASLMVSASASASAIRACSWRSSRTLLSNSNIFTLLLKLLFDILTPLLLSAIIISCDKCRVKSDLEV